MRKVLIFLFIAIFIPTASSFAGDSTSLAPQSAPQGSDYYTQGGDIYTDGGHVYTQGGHHYAGGGDIRDVDQLMANRIYAKGSSSWINYYDHVDMNNRVIYDVRRMRVNEYNPSYYKDVASKWYVDKNSGAPQGTMCGMWSNGPYIRDRCKGHNPYYSCPSGYAKRFDGTDFGTCVKQ